MSEPFDLSSLDAELEPLKLKDGSVHKAHPLDAAGYRLLEMAQKNLDDGAIVQKVIKRIVPTLTDDQYDTLTPLQIGAILAHGQGTLEPVLAALKKELGLQTTK